MLMLPDCTIIDIPTRRARVVCWVRRQCSCPKIKKLNNVITKENLKQEWPMVCVMSMVGRTVMFEMWREMSWPECVWRIAAS